MAVILCCFSSLDAQSYSTDPNGLDPMGLHKLYETHPQINGQTATIGLVEMYERSNDESGSSNFLPNLSHQAFSGIDIKGIYRYRTTIRSTTPSSHSTMIAGILFGDDPFAENNAIGKFSYRGILPQASLNIYETTWFIRKRIFTPNQTITDDVLSFSWGTDASSPKMQWLQRGVDRLVDANNCVVVAGCGNGEDQFKSITKPSSGYNVISVGAAQGLGNFPTFLNYVGPPLNKYSNRGPTDDGRSKPDIIAPGMCLGPSATNTNEYACHDHQASFSSYASPQVAGIAGLLIDAGNQLSYPEIKDPRLIKALLVNGANKLSGWHKGNIGTDDDASSPLDYQQGGGLVNAYNSYEHLISGKADENNISNNTGWDLDDISCDPNDPNHIKIYPLANGVESGQEIKVTLCWHAHFNQDTNFTQKSLSNLILELWKTNSEGELIELLDVSNSMLDNLQHIYHVANETTTLAILIRGLENKDNPSERFGLAFTTDQKNWSGDLLSADLNADGTINDLDLMEFVNLQSSDSESKPSLSKGDLNNDGILDDLDMNEILVQWNMISPWISQ